MLIRFNKIDYELLRFSPAVIAVACIMAARDASGVTPIWSKYLEYVTGMEYEQVKDCYEMLLRLKSHRISGIETTATATTKEDVGAMSEKVLELNQNIFNQIPATQPQTTKATMEGSCIVRGGAAKPPLKEEKFNIKAKREQIENIKKTIKDKLISLNNKSKSIETLLEDDVPPTRTTVFKSYREVNVKNTTNNRPESENTDAAAPVTKDQNKSGFLPLTNIERQQMPLKVNCSSVDAMIGLGAVANNTKEKENNKHAKPVHGEQARAVRTGVNHGVKDSMAAGDALAILLQKTMRI